MRFIPLGATLPYENQINILGVDLDTFLIVNARVEKTNDSLGNLFDVLKTYNVSSRIISGGLPQFIISDFTEDSDNDLDVDRLLEYLSSNVKSVMKSGNFYSLVKVSELIDIEVGNAKADLHVKVAGIPNKSFVVSVSDWKWQEYWVANAGRFDDGYSALKHFLSGHNVFLVLDTEQKINSGFLNCLSLVVV